MSDYTAEDTFERLKRMPFNVNDVNESTIEIEGIDRNDYPDFVDAYISYAEFENGTPLDEHELDQLAEYEDDIVFRMITNNAHIFI